MVGEFGSRDWEEQRTAYWVMEDAKHIEKTMKLTPSEQKKKIEATGKGPATMHLTNKEPIRSDAFAPSGHPDAAGAPEQEIEITPEMITAGVAVINENHLGLVADPSDELYMEVAISVYLEMTKYDPRFYREL
jgi:hypothetical protein